MASPRATISLTGMSVPGPVIFDLDGVLIDSEPLYELAFRSYLERIRREGNAELFAITLGRRQVDFLPELAERLGREPAELERGLEAALEPLLERLEPMPYAAETVRSLRGDGRSLALATSSTAEFAARALRRLELESLFDALVTGEEVERGKPDPAIYELAAERLGVHTRSCVAIEDTPAGVAAAKAAGMSCIAVPHGLSSRAVLGEADVIAADLRDAAAQVRRLDGRTAAPQQAPPFAT